MHGLINRSIQCFVSDTYGRDVWSAVTQDAGLGFEKFESMLEYDDAQTYAVLDAASARLSKSREMLLEDLGTYLVTNPHVKAPRRLLRFGGVNFVDFLHSLDDLHDRARLAVPELDLPKLELLGYPSCIGLTLYCRWRHVGFGHVLIGVLQAMADDYGALVLLEHQGTEGCLERISIKLLEAKFAQGNSFSLAGPESTAAQQEA